MTVEFPASVKRLVVKVGTSVLTDSHGIRVTSDRVEAIAAEVAELWKAGKEVVVVTSGAIGVGMGILRLKKRPTELEILQAAAAIGQGRLLQWYSTYLEREGFHVGQILLTRDDLENRRRYLNAKATLRTLLNAGVVPIINENDTISVEEIRYGDNDILSAHVAALVDADLLIVLSDVEGLEGPQGRQPLVTEITPELERVAQGSTKAISTGGMRTKLEAAKIAMAGGIPMLLTNGRSPRPLRRAILEKEFAGTLFLPRKGVRLKGKQRWLALTGKPKGTLLVDSGAKEALVHQGRSLLASGICGVEGSFRKGDLVSVAEAQGVKDPLGSARDFSGLAPHDLFRLARQIETWGAGAVGSATTRPGAAKNLKEIARGIVAYSHAELERIKGLKSPEIVRLLGRKADEVIHRDSLVILKGSGRPGT